MKNKRLKLTLTFTIAIIFFLGIANIISSYNSNVSIPAIAYENDNLTLEIRGTLDLDAEIYYGIGAVANITVNEELYNFDPGSIDYAYIFVNSSSDPFGILVELPETGLNTSIFMGTFTFSKVESNSTLDIILVQDGDTIIAHDNVTLSDSATWLESANQTIELDATTYYGVLAVATITVFDTNYNLIPTIAESVNVSVNSTIDITGISVQLTETEVNTSYFTGTFSFSTIVSDDPADIIRALDGDTIMAIHENITDTAIWIETVTGTINLDAFEYYGTAAIGSIAVTDSDLDITGSADIVDVEVYSTSDSVGINIQLTETGSTTGVFMGTFTFGITSSDPLDRIKAVDGDVITARYNDSHTVTGMPAQIVDNALWIATMTGIIDLNSTTYYGTESCARITVTDSDLDTTGGIDVVYVKVNSSSDNTGIYVQLSETGAHTGIFDGTFYFSTVLSSDPADVIKVQDGDTVMTIYNDSHTATGAFAQPKDTAIWNATVATGTMVLDDEYYSTGSTAKITVIDPDLNALPTAAESVKVNVTSEQDTTGINVTCTETGPNTGVFEGTFMFGVTSDDDADIIAVVNGSIITARYYDQANATGLPANVTDTATWIDTVNVTVNFDSSIYYGTAVVSTVTVVDVNYNLNFTTIESVSVSVNSSSDITGINVQLIETGVNTSIFVGSFTFNTSSSNDSLDIIWAQDGDTIMVIHDSLNDTATWIATVTGTVTLDSTTYYGTAVVATITVVDSDLDTTGATDNVDVNVNSSSDITGIIVQLTETGPTTGVFVGTFTFNTNISSDPLDIIRVQDGDTIIVIYNDIYDVTGTPAQSVDTAIWIETMTGTLDLDSTTYYGTGAVATITVTDSDLDITGGIDNVEVNVNSSSDSIGIIVQLSETGAITGIFEGNFTFSIISSNDPLDIIWVQDGDTIMVIYNDTYDINGTPVQSVDTAIWITDNINPSIILDNPQNETVLNKPAYINLTITDANLDPSTIEWRANVIQLIWTNTFVGSYDIDLSGFSSDQVVQFWIRANDTFGNQNITTVILTFDDTPPTKPTYQSVIIQPSNITISWLPSSDNNTVYYQIWRNGEYLGNTTLTYYMDLNVSKKKYLYEIRPVDEANNTGDSLFIYIKIKGPFKIPWIPPPNNTITIIIIIIGIVGASTGTVGVIVIRNKRKATQSKITKQKLAKKKKKIDSLAPRTEYKKHSYINLDFLLKQLKKEKYLTDLKREIAFLSEDEVIRVLKLDIPDNAEKVTILKELASLSPKEREEFLSFLENIK